MSFRGRLRLFFAILVIVPMVGIGVAFYGLVSSSEEGKSDARIATSLTVAFSLYNDARQDAQDELDAVASDRSLSASLARGDVPSATSRLRVLSRADPQIVTAFLRPTGGRLIQLGARDGVAAASVTVRRPGGRPVATLAVTTTHAQALAATVRRRTGVGLVIERNGRRIGASRGAPATVPDRSGNFDAGGETYRVRRQRVIRTETTRVDLVSVISREALDSSVSRGRNTIAAILLAFVLIVLAGSFYVIRALQGQVAQLLAAAQRLARGDFDSPVPTVGNDEFAQLGREFNRMSTELRAQMEEVQRRRQEVENTIQRVGAAFATGLDRQAVVALMAQTAVDACEADAAHALPLDVHVFDAVELGEQYAAQTAARTEAERAATAVRPGVAQELLEPRDPADPSGLEQLELRSVEVDGVHALAQPMLARLGARTEAQFIGVISISRAGEAFTRQEIATLEYLASQAVISIENADLHETVAQQAITDELTGLANVREMNDALDREFERGRRFDTPVSFVLLDIDDFKKVNDTYGHQQGDLVLSEMGRVLRALSRDIDEPARYGGEELAVVLPQTDLAGAAQLAERIRARVAGLAIPLAGGPETISVTASFGVASVPTNASDRASLVAAADEALYRAKRNGKNRVERATAGGGNGSGSPVDPAAGRRPDPAPSTEGH